MTNRNSRVFSRDASLLTRPAVSAQGCYVVDSSGKGTVTLSPDC